MYDFSGLKVLADIPRQQAKKRGNSTAMHFQGRETSYAALDTHTSQVANGLIAFGLKPHARIGYMGMNSDIFFEVLLGSFKANVVMVEVNAIFDTLDKVFDVFFACLLIFFIAREFIG